MSAGQQAMAASRPAEAPPQAARHAGELLIPCKPGIALAAAIAGFTGMVAAGRTLPEPATAFVCLLALLAAAAGAALVNSLLESATDCRMGRLKRRHETLLRLGSRRGWRLAFGLIGAALALALLRLNLLSALLLLAAVLHYTLVYTLWLKRRSPFAPLTGGVAGALPVLVGAAAATGTVEPAGLLLFLIMLLWQPPHFWVLALRYREEYRAAGVPVLPEIYGERPTRIAIALGIATLLPATLGLWLAGTCSAWFGCIAFVLWGAYLGLTVTLLRDLRRHRQAFALSLCYLNLLFLAVIGDICLTMGR